MRQYSGISAYNTNNIWWIGQEVNVVIRAPVNPLRFTVTVEDISARTARRLANRRLNYQARDSPRDLLARAKWTSDWRDRFTGPVYLGCPRVTGVPMELRIAAIRSCGPAFVVVEFRLADTTYQFSRRPLVVSTHGSGSRSLLTPWQNDAKSRAGE